MGYNDITRVQGNSQVTWWAVPIDGIANFLSPTAAEINAGVNITDAVKTDGMDFDVQASGSVDDRSYADSASTTYRDFTDWGGHLPLYFPLFNDDGSFKEPDGAAALAFQAIGTPRTEFWLVERVLQGGPTVEAASGDLISVYHVMTDARTKDTMTSGAGYTYQINLLPQGDVAINTLVKTTSAPTYNETSVTLASDGDVFAIIATLSGKNITQGANWTSSDTTKVTVSPNGVVKQVAGASAGTATITADHPAVGASDSGVTVTVTPT